MIKLIVWSLFDSGNGSYSKAMVNFPELENFSIGMDRENKNDHFINLNLAEYTQLFGEDKLFKELDKLPNPDIIIASPPCESWSRAAALKDGNVCWKQEKGDALFAPQIPLSKYTIRSHEDFENTHYKPLNQIPTRINGELTILNTIRIIDRYKPKVHIIENPAFGALWDYIKTILGFRLEFLNLTYYNNYNDWEIKKPTIFGSNINLSLKKDNVVSSIHWDNLSWTYNQKSNIPNDLVDDIFKKSINYINKLGS